MILWYLACIKSYPDLCYSPKAMHRPGKGRASMTRPDCVEGSICSLSQERWSQHMGDLDSEQRNCMFLWSTEEQRESAKTANDLCEDMASVASPTSTVWLTIHSPILERFSHLAKG